ncbi:hypothetical protein QFC21_000067 [Naganishia friedmannii]|uniref:Uncharacterized protein n=1 Tax=Naganishia friedmannii TaxID=89922 RepID=A0ACC2WCE5_9TREE|nr:hypothetical protein QFC21_000067 [Naganishia friedmannii]
MSNQPPSYQQAVSTPAAGLAPSINVSSAPSQPQGSTSAGSSAHHHNHGPHHNEFEDDSSDDGMDADGLMPPLKDDVEARKSMDDEYRELPEGWIRCFDKNTNHHFYVDVATERSSWLHPYDDPVYLSSLPDTHPANPNSEVARAARAKHEEIAKTVQQKKPATGSSSSSGRQDVHSAAQAAMAGGSASRPREERSMGGKLKDKLLGSTKEERRKAKLEQQARDRKAAEEYLARRKALMEKQANDPRLQGYYSSSPYRYSAPMDPYRSRYDVMYGPRYGYRPGYGGYMSNGYGYGYGGGLGMGGLGMGLGGGAMLGLGTGALLGAAMF